MKGDALKSYHANLGAGIAGIVLRESQQPNAEAHQILVRVRAVSLNARELSILRGYYPLPIKRDVVLASDGAGEVVAVGEGVTRIKIGERIAASGVTLSSFSPPLTQPAFSAACSRSPRKAGPQFRRMRM